MPVLVATDPAGRLRVAQLVVGRPLPHEGWQIVAGLTTPGVDGNFVIFVQGVVRSEEAEECSARLEAMDRAGERLSWSSTRTLRWTIRCRARWRQGQGGFVPAVTGSIDLANAAATAAMINFMIGGMRRTLTLSLYLGGHLSVATMARVVQRESGGMLLWLAAGAPVWRVEVPRGGHLRDVLPEERPGDGYSLVADEWRPRNNLLYMPAGAGFAVWWLFSADMAFEGWYVNLERRVHRGDDIDVIDHELDIVVDPERGWRWKDEESFVSKIGHPAHWSREESAAIRAEGERAVRLIEAGAFPFDGSWCDFSPPEAWGLPGLPTQPPKILAVEPSDGSPGGRKPFGGEVGSG